MHEKCNEKVYSLKKRFSGDLELKKPLAVVDVPQRIVNNIKKIPGKIANKIAKKKKEWGQKFEEFKKETEAEWEKNRPKRERERVRKGVNKIIRDYNWQQEVKKKGYLKAYASWYWPSKPKAKKSSDRKNKNKEKNLIKKKKKKLE